MDLANKEDFGLASYFYSKSLFQKRIRPTESGSKNYTGFKLWVSNLDGCSIIQTDIKNIEFCSIGSNDHGRDMLRLHWYSDGMVLTSIEALIFVLAWTL
jgi:hypothetical protein